MSDTTKIDRKSSQQIAIVKHESNDKLTPLVPEPPRVFPRDWFDKGRPDNTSNEYPGWIK
jgi:hypothetical protein